MPLKCLCLFHRTNKVHNPIKDDILSFDCACSGCFTFVESASGMVRVFWYLFMLFNRRQRLLGGKTLLRLNELGKRSLWLMLTRCTLSCEARLVRGTRHRVSLRWLFVAQSEGGRRFNYGSESVFDDADSCFVLAG